MTAVSSKSDEYVVFTIEPGNDNITIDNPGFRPMSVQNVVLRYEGNGMPDFRATGGKRVGRNHGVGGLRSLCCTSLSVETECF